MKGYREMPLDKLEDKIKRKFSTIKLITIEKKSYRVHISKPVKIRVSVNKKMRSCLYKTGKEYGDFGCSPKELGGAWALTVEFQDPTKPERIWTHSLGGGVGGGEITEYAGTRRKEIRWCLEGPGFLN